MEGAAAAVTDTTKSTILNCIDLSDPDAGKSVRLLKQACLDSGFFYLINHGISQEFMDEVFKQSKRFFDLPLKEKFKSLKNEKHRGYTPMLDETLDPANQVNGDYKEGYYIGVEVPEDSLQLEKPFYGPNLWPSEEILPGWRQIMGQYHKKAFEVTKAVARIIALALDLESDFFDKPGMLGEPIATLRLLHYEGRSSNPVNGIYGAGAHTDYGLITLLATDDVKGLQICKEKDAHPQVWEFVEPMKGAFIVNLGDMLERWSNGLFRSTLHRVLVDGRERYSIAYFVEPNHDCLVECLPTCRSETNPPKSSVGVGALPSFIHVARANWNACRDVPETILKLAIFLLLTTKISFARFPPVKCADYLLQRYKETHRDLSSYNEGQT